MVFVNKRVMVVLALLAMAACAPARTGRLSLGPVPNPALKLPEGNLTIAGSGGPELSLHVQIAQTARSQQQGLMGVKKMPDQVGMVFLFGGPTATPFWMKDTLIPLDIAFWDSNGRVVDAFTMTPCRTNACRFYYPAGAYVASVEMNAGLLAARGVRTGDKVSLAR